MRHVLVYRKMLSGKQSSKQMWRVQTHLGDAHSSTKSMPWVAFIEVFKSGVAVGAITMHTFNHRLSVRKIYLSLPLPMHFAQPVDR